MSYAMPGYQPLTDPSRDFQECFECIAYDDVTQVDTFLESFGDDGLFICGICAEEREAN